MKQQSLFRPERFCIVCHCKASNGAKKRTPGEPTIIAITPVMYRRGTGKGKLRNAARVTVCEECMSKAGTAGWLKWVTDFRPLIVALFLSLIECLSKMSADDAYNEVERPDWRNPSQETFL
jgi:hypothetical protein